MLKRLNSERGMTLPELLVAMTLMIIVLTATLNTLDAGGANRRLNDDRNDAVEQARSSIDLVVRQLRNLATPTATTPSAIDRAQANDFSFRTFDPNKRLVRYCLETTGTTPGVPITSNATRLIQMLSVSNAPGSYDNCTLNTTGWSSIKVVASRVVNIRTPNAVDLFAYDSSSTDFSTIKNVRINLLIDVNSAAKRPSQVRLASGADLRNQNQKPLATFSVTRLSPRHFLMNGTTSSDPEGRNLIFSWYADVGAGFVPSAANAIGSGSVLDYTFLSGVGSPANYYVKLVVSDSNLTDTCPTSAGVTTNCSTAGPIPWT
jgi:type II secretory pathway pseudopilin PulG